MRTYAPASTEAVLERMLEEPSLARGVIHHEVLPPREAEFAPFPDWVDPRIRAGLASRGIGELYTHQAAAIDAAIEVHAFDGLAVDFARDHQARFVVRGLRSGADLDYESPMAAMNGMMAPAVETVFLVAAPALAPIASSLVKDVARAGGPVDLFVPAAVAAAIRTHLR